MMIIRLNFAAKRGCLVTSFTAGYAFATLFCSHSLALSLCLRACVGSCQVKWGSSFKCCFHFGSSFSFGAALPGTGQRRHCIRIHLVETFVVVAVAVAVAVCWFLYIDFQLGVRVWFRSASGPPPSPSSNRCCCDHLELFCVLSYSFNKQTKHNFQLVFNNLIRFASHSLQNICKKRENVQIKWLRKIT